MGYDCYVQGRCGAEVVDDHDYLRRSVWGMRPTVAALVALGAAYESPGPRDRDGTFLLWAHLPEWRPEWAKALKRDEVPADPVYDQREAALEHLLSAPGAYDTPGIPSHKFTSNDGWHVTRIECASAVAIIERAPTPWPPDVAEFMRDDVLPFLQTAARHDGFRVH